MEDHELNLKEYWRISLQWWWILALGLVGTAAAVYLMSSLITPTYQSTTKILVQGGQTSTTPFLPEFRVSQDLARSYRDLIKTRPIMVQVIEELSLPYGPSTLKSKVGVTNRRSIIQIIGTDHDPELAAQIANTAAAVFIDDFRSRQFSDIAQLQAALSQRGFVNDPSIIAAQAATLSTLSIVEEAVPAFSPFSPRVRLNTIVGGALGLLSAALVVFLIEYLSDRIKSPNEVKSITGITSLVSIIRYPSNDKSGPTILDSENRTGALAESFKFLAINLDFASTNEPGVKSLLITSSIPGEGKTTTAVNLSIALASMGRSVILIDSDLRRPNLHRIFELPEDYGLTQVLEEEATLDETLNATGVENLHVLTSGTPTDDIAPLLRSPKMTEIMAELQSKAEIIILDSPPLLNVADTLLLAQLVDGVLFVVDAHSTGRATVLRAAEALEQAQVTALGAVFNKVTAKDMSYYRYYYEGYGYSSRGPQNGNGRRFKLFGIGKNGDGNQRSPVEKK